MAQKSITHKCNPQDLRREMEMAHLSDKLNEATDFRPAKNRQNCWVKLGE